MKKKENYFTLVDAEVVSRLKRSDEPYTFDPNVSISDIFEQNGVPEKYRKFILKLNLNSIFKDSDAKEYISGYPIDFINTRKIYEGVNLVGFGCQKVALVFRFLLNMVNNEGAMAFYDDLVSSGFLDAYLRVIGEVFGRDVSDKKHKSRIRKYLETSKIAAMF